MGANASVPCTPGSIDGPGAHSGISSTSANANPDDQQYVVARITTFLFDHASSLSSDLSDPPAVIARVEGSGCPPSQGSRLLGF
jgi:hypothetical protein